MYEALARGGLNAGSVRENSTQATKQNQRSN
jgi:hypothetical protein